VCVCVCVCVWDRCFKHYICMYVLLRYMVDQKKANKSIKFKEKSRQIRSFHI
jgi:hypothetical protein